MSVDQEFAGQSEEREVLQNDGVDPFAIVGGLIVSILIASLLLWIIGADEIRGSDKVNVSPASSAITAADLS